MLIRMWKGNVKEENVKRFEDVFEHHDLPILRAQNGCLGAFLSRDYWKGEGSYSIITLWHDMDSLKAFTGAEWKKPVPGPTEEKLVEGVAEVQNYSLFQEE
jgi:heme-degrading monooxygenase HmoA